MKIKLNKWIGLITGMFLFFIGLNSCVKNRNAEGTDFSHLQDHVLILNGGISGFSASNVAFSSDTATLKITVYLASVNLPTSPLTVTIGIDNSQIATYNTANGKNFVAIPDSAFSFATTTLTIPAGQQYATTTISFYKAKIDGGLSYLIPVAIKDASGKSLSSNENTQLFNIIGNPLAGTYSDVGYFYHPSSPRPLGPTTKKLTAISATVLQVDLGDLGGSGYIAYLTVDPATNKVTEFDPPGYYNATDDFIKELKSLADATPPGYTAAWSGSVKCNNTYDPATKTFYLRYGYIGGSGYRVTEEILVRQ
ncbi:DUF1735 domain-containing protein [Ginsengibacter hankyongi]|uniref:DUF1735 domain-containing protein n=1 Tax=Ginsengibacter hankyongi TaxID=2607284 RepID=A0A5J5IJU9_9BACT|nr:DUF1735 domain-containing protein [Ginsengibacter hankyongi]KAA9041345.1 DUF1735 domain-containing protein [Ginsengibacter hankyongi]